MERLMGEVALVRVNDRERDVRGRRFLVERLWPRGIRRDHLRLDSWLPAVGPSHELRKWFAHDPDRWRNSLPAGPAGERAAAGSGRRGLTGSGGAGWRHPRHRPPRVRGSSRCRRARGPGHRRTVLR
ncbi:DUF488 domain-containing protein [Geodermatophilus sp. URMC 64]